MDTPKGENIKLKSKIDELEMEEKRNYQMKKVNDKLYRQNMLRRKNLVVDGIPEASKNEKRKLSSTSYWTKWESEKTSHMIQRIDLDTTQVENPFPFSLLSTKFQTGMKST